jgi:hypothetical protein
LKVSIEDILNLLINIKSVLADGSYDSDKNFKYLYGKNILPGIKIRKNSITSTENTNTRNKEDIAIMFS